MNPETEKYLEEIKSGLTAMLETDRESILQEVKNHISAATEKGEDMVVVVARLGSPERLAKAYTLGYRAEQKKLNPSDVLSNLSFYALAGLSAVSVISLLGFLAAVFLAIAVIIPGTSITNLIGLTNVSMFVWGEASVSPGIIQIALAFAVGAVFLWLANLCWKGIKGHIKDISADYRKHMLGE